MSGPRPVARNNACRACARAKRACDRRVPRCRRCADRDMACQYGPGPGRGDAALARLAPRPPAAFGAGQPHGYRTRLSPGGGQALISDSPLAAFTPFHDAAASQLPVALDEFLSSSIGSPRLAPTIDMPSADPELSWFLTQDSWHIKEGGLVPGAAAPADLVKNTAQLHQRWLRDWAVHGHNIFMHRQLYHPALPRCLQDAYTALVAYRAKTEATADMVLQIDDARARSLREDPPHLPDTRAHLARTQALLVYVLIQLFDGCPLQRALAEAALLTLYEWVFLAREAAVAEAPRLYEELGVLRAGGGRSELALWRAWVLSESLRRTWMLALALVAIYKPRRAGGPGCSGVLSFTTRQGLWAAGSGAQWAQRLRGQSPLFDESVRLHELMEETPPAELDEFTNQVLVTVLPPEQIDRWVAKTTRLEA